VNTIGAILGSLLTAWLTLPALGFARTSWVTGIILGAVGIVGMTGLTRTIGVLTTVSCIAIAVTFESGLGRDRVGGETSAHRVVAFSEGPDSTVSVIETGGGVRELIIDGCPAASEHDRASYMQWMGTLPALLHEDPRRGLVICFGTGQTANALRREAPETVDLVDISPAVFALAPLFLTNEGVLDDERFGAFVMDGRAWLRRQERTYDVITLEPMPPNFAGVNALYSREFYELMTRRLAPGGLVTAARRLARRALRSRRPDLPAAVRERLDRAPAGFRLCGGAAGAPGRRRHAPASASDCQSALAVPLSPIFGYSPAARRAL